MSVATPAPSHVPNKTKFHFIRQIDGLSYTFTKQSETESDKSTVWIREDGAIQVVYDPTFGWSTWSTDEDVADGAAAGKDKIRVLTGRVWDVPPHEQDGMPTETVWVSRKGKKSYVYDLRYMLE